MAINLKKKNFAKGELNAGITDSATSLTLKASQGALFPATGSGNPFIAVIWASTQNNPFDDSNREVVEAYRDSGDIFTITRAQEGTSAKAWSADDNFMLILSTGGIEEIETEVNTKITASSTDTLTNKTINTASNTITVVEADISDLGSYITASSTDTLTNKRINPRQDSSASSASITPDKATYDEHYRTAQAAAITINNATSPSVGDKFTIYLTDNATARAISFGAHYSALDGQALPTTTTISKSMEIICKYVTATKCLVSYTEEA